MRHHPLKAPARVGRRNHDGHISEQNQAMRTLGNVPHVERKRERPHGITSGISPALLLKATLSVWSRLIFRN